MKIIYHVTFFINLTSAAHHPRSSTPSSLHPSRPFSPRRPVSAYSCHSPRHPSRYISSSPVDNLPLPREHPPNRGTIPISAYRAYRRDEKDRNAGPGRPVPPRGTWGNLIPCPSPRRITQAATATDRTAMISGVEQAKACGR